MDAGTALVWPVMLVLARVSAFLLIAPLFSSGFVPRVSKVGLTLVITGFLAFAVPMRIPPADPSWVSMGLAMVKETVYGLAIGLAARMAYMAVQQAGIILAQQMGLTDAEVIDPSSGGESEAIATFLELTFAMMFLAAGGHQLLLMVLAKSYQVFPALSTPDISALTGAIIAAGSAMMLFALKLAAPALVAFMLLAVVLSILARAMPDMNILFDSFPLRIGLGLVMASTMMPALDRFNLELAMWIRQFFAG